MILSDRDLLELLPTLLQPSDPTLVNPASVDIRIGGSIILESPGHGMNRVVDITMTSPYEPVWLPPGGFALVATLETITVPNGYVLELRLKSSMARRGFNHSLAFWFDPGWQGIGTMEIHNLLQHRRLALWYGMRFAQVVVHKLTSDAIRPYTGKYNNATGVERDK